MARSFKVNGKYETDRHDAIELLQLRGKGKGSMKQLKSNLREVKHVGGIENVPTEPVTRYTTRDYMLECASCND